jgi:3-methyladenine DNA glycosylase AlkD
MEYAEAMTALEKLGNPQTKKTWLAHGATGALFGVKIGDMKGLVKQLKGRQDVALKLYASGNLEAMYMAGLIADGAKMSKPELETWAKSARWQMISEYTVPWVACESPHARELALAWTRSADEGLASIGWNTYAGIVCTRPDSDLDLKEIEGLLARIEKEIGRAKDRVRYCMNSFVIAVGTAVKPLLAKAKATARRLGKVEVDMGDSACRVPVALEAIAKVESMGRVGKKRASMKC